MPVPAEEEKDQTKLLQRICASIEHMENVVLTLAAAAANSDTSMAKELRALAAEDDDDYEELDEDSESKEGSAGASDAVATVSAPAAAASGSAPSKSKSASASSLSLDKKLTRKKSNTDDKDPASPGGNPRPSLDTQGNPRPSFLKRNTMRRSSSTSLNTLCDDAQRNKHRVKLPPSDPCSLVRVNIFNIREVSTKNQSVKVDFYLDTNWELPFLDDDNEGTEVAPDDSQVDWEEAWKPQLVFFNKVGELTMNQWSSIIAGGNGARPRVAWRAKITGDFSQTFDLKQFPFDKHLIEIVITTDRLRSECDLVPNEIVKSGAQVKRFTILEEWEAECHEKLLSSLQARKGVAGEYSQVAVKIHVARRPGFWLGNTMLLMFALVILYFICVFSIPAEDIAARMEIGSNLILTAVALKLLSVDKLPDLCYMTFFDKYVMGSIMFLMLLCAYCFLASELLKNPQYAEVNFDIWVALSSSMVWILGNSRLYSSLCVCPFKIPCLSRAGSRVKKCCANVKAIGNRKKKEKVEDAAPKAAPKPAPKPAPKKEAANKTDAPVAEPTSPVSGESSKRTLTKDGSNDSLGSGKSYNL